MFNRLLHPLEHPAAVTPASPALQGASSRAEKDTDDHALPDKHGIEVEEISQVEFLREWGRAIARKALAVAVKNSDENR
jgi:hypothetical protein